MTPARSTGRLRRRRRGAIRDAGRKGIEPGRLRLAQMLPKPLFEIDDVVFVVVNDLECAA
jgi:hypothetical protein